MIWHHMQHTQPAMILIGRIVAYALASMLSALDSQVSSSIIHKKGESAWQKLDTAKHRVSSGNGSCFCAETLGLTKL